jgi:predicted transcriptional regulator of viral defense system
MEDSLKRLISLGSFSQKKMTSIFFEYRDYSSYQDFMNDVLTNLEFDELEIRMENGTVYERFLLDDASPYELILSFVSPSHISHTSALDLRGILPQNNCYYCTNSFTKKHSANIEPISQEQLNLSFSKPARKTNNRTVIKDDTLVLFQAKNIEVGIQDIEHNGRLLKASSITRAFIEIVMKPEYFGGEKGVLKICSEVKDDIDVYEIVEYFKEAKFVYPYIQLVAYYLDKVKALSDQDKQLLKDSKKDLNIYTEREMEKFSFNQEWGVYHLEGS